MIKVCPTCEQKYPEDVEFCARDGARLEAMSDDTGDDLIGRVLDGRWVIDKKIGEGGMGAVYLASQRSVDRQVAVKTLRPELSSSGQFVDRFFREARVATTINHPHCVTILDFGQTDDGLLFLAMEYLDGQPLTNRLAEGDLQLGEIVRIGIQIAGALAAAHSHQIIHRDLKPDNVFLLDTPDGSTFTKVLDFGIAKVLDAEEKMTRTGQVFGTPEYMSPEQCRGDADIDGRSDLYALGCILYEMLGGRPPFESATPMATLVSHVQQRPKHVGEATGRDVPQGLADLVMNLLEKDPADRMATATDVRAALEKQLAGITSERSYADAVAAAHAAGQRSAGAGATARPTTPARPQSPPSDQQPVVLGGTGKQQAAQQPTPAQQTPPAPAPQATPSQSAPESYTPNKKSKAPLVIGLLVGLALFGACALGGGYLAYTTYWSDDAGDEAFGALTGDNEAAADELPGEATDDTVSEEAADEVEVAAEVEAAAEASDSEEAAAGGADSAGGAKTGDDAKAAGAKADDGARPASTVAVDEMEADEMEADELKADAATGAKPADKPDEPQKPAEPSKPKKPELKGTVAAGNISTTGAACIRDDVEQVLRRARSAGFRKCYSDALDADPNLSGEAMMSFNISTDGSVITPELPISSVNPINSCLMRRLKSLQFTPPSGGRCYVRAKFSFRP